MKTSSYHWTAALFSFLRVLVVAEASALLPLFVTDNDGYPTLGAMGLAMIPAFLLTVGNFFREGETRFGVSPNPDAEGGYAVLSMIGIVLAVVGAVLLVFAAVDTETLSKPGLILLAVGAVLYFVDRDGARAGG